jgi:hypothetical protein
VACRKRYDEEPRKPQRLLKRGEMMKLTELGHERGEEPQTQRGLGWSHGTGKDQEGSQGPYANGVSYGAY